MSNMLDVHAKLLKKIIRHHGRPVLLTDPDGNEYFLTALWNDVEHVLKMDNFSSEPMGGRSSLYFDRDSLQLDTGPILPETGWTATGSPNPYDEEKTYVLEVPKKDSQLPGALYFISGEVGVTSDQWGTVD